MKGRRRTDRFGYPPGASELPGDFSERLCGLKERSGLTWEAMAEALGVETRQLFRWRRGTEPKGGAMLSLFRLASQVPDGLGELLEDPQAGVARKRDQQ